MLQGANDRNFFAVAKGQRIDLAGSVQLKAFAKLLCFRSTVGFSQVSRKIQNITDAHSAVEQRLRGKIAYIAQNRAGIPGNVMPEHRSVA